MANTNKNLFKKSIWIIMIILIPFSFLLSACSPTNYKIYYVVDSEVYSISIIKENKEIVFPIPPQKAGYSFSGWYLDENVWQKEFTENYFLNKHPNKDLNVFAKWDYVGAPTYMLTAIYDYSLSPNSSTDNIQTAVDSTISKLNTLFYNYVTTITKLDDSKIKIQMLSDPTDGNIFELIGNPLPLYMTLNQSSSAEKRIVGTDIDDVQTTYQKNQSGEYGYGITLKFSEEGSNKFASLTEDAANGEQEIYIYYGDIDDSADLVLTCEQKITSGSTFISGYFDTHFDASNFSIRILSGSFDVKLELDSYSYEQIIT